MRSSHLAMGLAAFLFVAACGGGATGGGGTSGCSKVYKVGLVTDVGKLSDKSFNATSWQGVRDAENDKSLCVEGKPIESNQPTDYATNMQTFVDQGYDMVVAVGFLMADDTLAEAKKNPKVKFAIVDNAYTPDQNAPSNLVGLVFKEDQAGFLIGALAGYMTKTGQVGQVLGLKIPPVQRYGEGFIAGVKYANPNAKPVLTVYQGASDGAPFNNPDWGKARAIDEVNQGADIIFGGGGNTGNGALLGALSKGVACIGVDTDQYLSYPDADKCLMTSAEKKLAVAVKKAITDMVRNQWPTGNLLTFDAGNQGVGIAPYHDYESKIPGDVKAKIQDIQARLANGTLQTGVKIG